MLSRNLRVVTDEEIMMVALGILILILTSSLATRCIELAGMKFGFISYLIIFLGDIHFSGKSLSHKHVK